MLARPTFRQVVPCALALAISGGARAGAGWSDYGGDAGGTRYSTADQITPANVGELRRQWLYRTGDKAGRAAPLMRRVKFETTPILADGRLVLCSSFNEVIALDPRSGRELWRFDPKVATDRRPANRYNCRGVAYAVDAAAQAGAICRGTIYSGTVDARLIALDVRSGRPCPGFGSAGEVRIDAGAQLWPGELQITSPPVVASGVVIVGSAIGDNVRAAAPSGAVRAFDARSGRALWSFDPLERPSAGATSAASDSGAVADPGAANVWAPMSVDAARGLVFLPTSSPSPDFFGGARPGPNRNADSVVALHIADGSPAWAFQIVKHDVWDYDVASQPTLATIHSDGRARDVVVQATKQGLVFVLDRDTGVPVFPVEERAVSQRGAPGELLSPTQTFPADLPPLVPSALQAGDAFGFTPFDRGACRKAIARYRNEGLYTPPSLEGSIVYPFDGGGINWGGVAIDPQDVVYVNTSRLVHVVTLIPRADYAAAKAAEPGKEISPQLGTPYAMKREVLLSPFGAPCNRPPWGTLAALDLRHKRLLWHVPLGSSEDLLPLGLALATGTPNFGGPVATAGGLVFIGAAMDRYLRAFEATSGRELWAGRLPAAGMATPMSYVLDGRQYVVVAAGGHGEAGVETGDAIVAFALPAPGEARRGWWERHVDQPGGRLRHGALATALLAAALGALWLRRRRRRARAGTIEPRVRKSADR
jgi:quinoprotein glucose dehydrogenase